MFRLASITLLTLYLPPSSTAPAPTLKDEMLSFFPNVYKSPGEFDEVVSILSTLQHLAFKHFYGGLELAFDKPQELEDNSTIVSISVAQPGMPLRLTQFFFESDVVLSPEQARHILQALLDTIRRKKREARLGPMKTLRRRKRKMYAQDRAHWPLDTPINYLFNPSLSTEAREAVTKAIGYWQDNTCLQFNELSTGEGDYIEYFRGQGCYSMIGKTGGRQGLSIGKGCESAGIAAHETGHALGLWHEQSRPDRDCCITINKDDIIASTLSNFYKRANSEVILYDTKFDVGSVMHYGPTAFTKDWSKFTIATKNPSQQRTIGQREKLSFFDIMIMNNQYCRDKCSYSLTCYAGGYQHPGLCNRCICPEGVGGTYCDRHEDPHPSSLDCGGTLSAGGDWEEIKSPGYPNPGYDPDQKCSWLIQAPRGKRVMLEFQDRFQFWCTTTCMDYVEVKNATDLRLTGMRFCCWTAPEGVIYSEDSQMVVIFRAAVSRDVGFKARIRMYPSDSATVRPRRTTTTTTTTTTARPWRPRTTTDWWTTTTRRPTTTTTTTRRPDRRLGLWTGWSLWGGCTKDCGACGIARRSRACQLSPCSGSSRQYRQCGFKPCYDEMECETLGPRDRCEPDDWLKFCVKTKTASFSCTSHSCCPPFTNIDGYCRLGTRKK